MLKGFTGHEVATQASDYIVIYHGTPVAERRGATVTLRTGGWWTVTTKRRMNRAAEAWGLPFKVYQQDGQWYVDTVNGTVPFPDDGVLTFEALN